MSQNDLYSSKKANEARAHSHFATVSYFATVNQHSSVCIILIIVQYFSSFSFAFDVFHYCLNIKMRHKYEAHLPQHEYFDYLARATVLFSLC